LETTDSRETGSINPIENLSGWLEAQTRDAEPTTSTGQGVTEASPAEPTVAVPVTPAQPASVLEAVLPEDFEHGFFRNKPVSALYTSYTHAERAKQEAEKKANELERRLAAIEQERQIEATTRRVLAEQTAPPAVADDPFAEIEREWFENPRGAATKLREQTLAEAKQAAAEEAARVRDETRRESEQHQIVAAGRNAYDAARTALNLDEATWQKRAKAVLVELTDEASPYYGDGHNLFRPDAYVAVYRDMFGDPAPPSMPPLAAVPAVADPPGSKRPAAAVTSSQPTSALAEEQVEAWTALARAAGTDPKVFIAKMSRR
jgi:hypothetical protein